MGVAVFHRIGDEGEYTNPIQQILDYEGIITFDGAYKSVYEYRFELGPKNPILFVQADTVGTPGVCTWEEIGELARLGFTLGWHGRSHRKLPDLPDHAVIRELTPSGPEFKLYAYPHGNWDARVAKIVKDMGYLRAYSTTQGEDGNDYAIIREYLPN